MSEIVTHSPGTFCWVELTTTDAAAAKPFYEGLLGWSTREDPIPGGGAYIMATAHDGNVAGMWQMDEDMKAQGVPPHWMLYVSVTDADATARRAAELGGTVVKEPFDVMEFGRMAVLKDPTGAAFSIWQPQMHHGFGHADGSKPGTVCWTELATDNVDAAGKFYADLFGWKPSVQDMGEFQYTVFHNGDKQAGGMMPMQGDQWKGIPPHWMLYFSVADCDASVARAKELGGDALVPPTDIPQVGRFAVLRDPASTHFSILTLTENAS